MVVDCALMWTTLLLALTLSSLSPAAAEAPEYLLGDLGVRLDLSKSRWHMTRWSDFDFEAKGTSDPILLYAWATPVRSPVDDPSAWGPTFLAKIEGMKGTDPKIVGTSAQEVGGHAYAYVDASFKLKGAGNIALRGATTEIDGQNFHFAVVAPSRMGGRANRDRAEIARRLDFATAVPEAPTGGEVSADGLTTTLPEGWRPLATGELSAVTSRLVKLGLEDLEGCWTAIHPIPTEAPDVMVTCSRPLALGVVDEHSFAARETILREKLFGMKEAGGVPVEAADRMGFLFTPRDGLAFGVLPDNDHVRVTWALGEGDLGGPVRSALTNARFDEPHEVEALEQISYYLGDRTFSPMVLCPLGCICGGVVLLAGGIGLGVMLRTRRRGDPEDE